MSPFAVSSFPGTNALAESAAAQWAKKLESEQFRTRPWHVALAGGRIAGVFLSAAAGLARSGRLDLSSVHFYWGDERCVGPTDAESNFRLAQENLFRPLGINSAHVHRICGEHPPEAAAAEATAEMLRWVPLNANGQPELDLVFLGMGEDGHVASLFPGEPADVVSNPGVYRAVKGSKPPPDRVTLGYPVLAAALEVWVLVSGEGKRPALEASLRGQTTPLGHLLRLRSYTRILIDTPLDSLQKWASIK